MCLTGSVHERINGSKLVFVLIDLYSKNQRIQAANLMNPGEIVEGILEYANSRALAKAWALLLRERIVFYRVCAIMIRSYSANVMYPTLINSIRSVFSFERMIST
jgi:hypothetical protein